MYASAKRPILTQPDGGVTECFIKDGIPQVDFTTSKCITRHGGDIPKWLSRFPRAGGRKREHHNHIDFRQKWVVMAALFLAARPIKRTRIAKRAMMAYH